VELYYEVEIKYGKEVICGANVQKTKNRGLMMSKRALLMLEDGFFMSGRSFGSEGETLGEVVFNTSMTGYQEVLTDPSSRGKIVTMTYPLIGNYGVNEEDVESARLWLDGFIVREKSRVFSNWRAKGSLEDYLAKNKIVGLEGVDTRALTRRLRLGGAMRGIISTEDHDHGSLKQKVLALPVMVGRNLVKDVTCRAAYDWPSSPGKKDFFVVCLDFGVKFNILRFLDQAGCRVKVVPASTSANEVLGLKPDGVFLSNGPGDPAVLTLGVEEVKALIGKVQLLGLALGAKTYKMKFGHHGGNHPVMEVLTGKIEITVQNHDFCVDVDSIKDKNVVMTHRNLYDRTVEGIRHKKLPFFSVQYHPEAGPGPHDAGYLFKRFTDMMKKFRPHSRGRACLGPR
jgi:carbamoyl-phosphate synthase small subunit